VDEGWEQDFNRGAPAWSLGQLQLGVWEVRGSEGWEQDFNRGAPAWSLGQLQLGVWEWMKAGSRSGSWAGRAEQLEVLESMMLIPRIRDVKGN
jgi:hypothetical protein